MNREILFRGKRIDNGEWIVGYYFVVGGISCILPEGYSLNGMVAVAPSTIGQYTGKDDVRHQKIFGGDILEIRYGTEKYNGLVKYDTYGAKFIIACNRGTSSFDDLLWDVEIQVIGNIHDNPELLEKKEA